MALVLHHAFAVDRSLTDREAEATLTCTRASTATYRNSAGLLATASTNEARFGYDVNGNCLGLLIEEARTNLLTDSEDFSTSWAGVQYAVNTNVAVAPDGTTTADRFIDDNGGGSGTIRISQGVSGVSTSTSHAVSIFAKADGLSWFALQPNGFTTPNNPNALMFFDLANGVTGAGGSYSSALDDYGIEDWGNGWYRCWVSFTTDASDTTGAIYIYLANGDDDRVCDRDGTSSVFLWGAQLEEADKPQKPSSYIPTAASTVTRAADDLISTDVSWFTAGQPASFYVRATNIQTDDVTAAPAYHLFITANTGGAVNDRRIMYCEGNYAKFYADGTGSAAVIQGTNEFANFADVRYVAGLDTNDAALYAEGVQIGTDNTVGIPALAPDKYLIGSRWTTSGHDAHANGYIKEVAVWDERLSDAELEAYSAGTVSPGDVGAVAWVDYIPVYVVTGRTKRWRTDDDEGFIPVVYQ